MTEEENQTTIPPWFWIVTSVALIWNIMGVGAFIQQATLTPEDLATMTAAQQELYISTPDWVNWIFAISVFGGVLGCLLLILKKAIAKIVLIISFVAVLIQMWFIFIGSKAVDSFGPGGALMPVMIVFIAAGLVWLSLSSAKKGWIN